MNTPKTKSDLITTETIRDDVRELAQDTRQLARQHVDGLTETVKETASRTFDTVREKREEVADTAREAMDRGRHIVSNEYERAIDYLRQNPLTAISVGVVVGVAMSAMFRRR